MTATPPATGVRSAPDHRPSGDPDGVRVLVLGPVQVDGAARAFRRARTLDLVVYLALHPAGALTDAWATALWPDRLMSAATLHSTASAARRSLGRDAGGRDHLPRARGRLRLAPSVTTDWSDLRRAAAASDPRRWAAGLSLVRGRPFDGLADPDWVVLEGIGAEVEEAVAQLALRVGQHHLETGAPADAARAARRGLLTSPYDERLYRLLLRAADAGGHPAGVEAAMAELLRLVGGEARTLAGVHPETSALYRELSRRGGGGTGGRPARR